MDYPIKVSKLYITMLILTLSNQNGCKVASHSGCIKCPNYRQTEDNFTGNLGVFSLTPWCTDLIHCLVSHHGVPT